MNTKKLNPIQEDIKKHYEELESARSFCQNAMKVLDEDSFVVKAEVGILLQEMPSFKFLKPQAAFLAGNLNQVCSGELKVCEAYEIILKVYKQIMEAMPLINETMLK